MSSLRKNVASQHISFQLVAKADGAPVTASGAGNVTKDGAAQAACTGTFTHLGTGQWDYAPTQAETNATAVGFQFTGTGAVNVNLHFFTDNWDTTATGVPLTSAERNSVADALLARNIAGGSSSGRIVSEALYILRNKVSLALGTVYGVDDTTPSWTFTVTTDAAALPITVVDPA